MKSQEQLQIATERTQLDRPAVPGQGQAPFRTMSMGAIVLGLVVAGAPAVSQQDQSGNGADGSGGPTLSLPLIGDVPLPGWLAFLATDPAGGGGGQGGGRQGSQGPPAVVFTRADVRPVAERFTFMGRVAPIEQVALQARISGFIEEVAFRGGDMVSEGDLLFQIETDQYDAALSSAEAALESARSQRRDAERDLERSQELQESNTVSQASLDDATAAFEATRGDVLQAEAEVEQARLDLSYTAITAPISGQMSAPATTRGNFVGPSSGTLADLLQLDPIWGIFALNERRLVEWRRLGIGTGETAPISSGNESDRSAPEAVSAPADRQITDAAYDLALILPDGSVYDSEGRFDFVGNVVNSATGTVEVRVRFDNPDGLLLPNQNVTLRVREADPPEYPVVPQAAVQLSRDGRAVWIIGEGDQATRVNVEIADGPDPGTFAVTSGLDGGERVIVRGAMNLEEGQEVDPRQSSEARIAGTEPQ